MAGDYRLRIEDRVDCLRATPGFSVSTCEVAPPASDEELESAVAAAHGLLPVGVEKFYRELNGFDLEWEYVVPGHEAVEKGSIRICTLAEVFADGLGSTWFDDFEGGDRFRDVKPFDAFVAEACAAFLQDPGEVPQDHVHFHNYGEGTRPLGLTFPQYLEGALASCGYFGWHLALTPDHPGLPGARTALERIHEIVPGFDGFR